MSFIIAFLIIIILSISISYLSNKKIEYIIPITTACISIIMYIFGYFGVRNLGILTIILLLISLLSLSIYKRVKKNEKIINTIKSSGLIYFVLVFLFILVITQNFAFSTWDEFSHWGLVLKNIFLTNDFGNLSSSTTYFQSYPPGISMFLSFINSFSNNFNEANALRGMLLLSFSELTLIFSKIRYNDWKKILLVTSLIMITPTIFFSGFYSSIYVDAVLGLILCNIFFFDYLYNKKDFFYMIFMSSQFYLLINTKQIGIGLAVIAFSAILLKYLFKINKKNYIKSLLKNKTELIYTATPMAVGLITTLSWKMYIKLYTLSEIFNISSVKFSDLISGNIPSYWKKTILNFVNNFVAVNQHGAIFYSTMLLSLFLLLLLFYIFKKSKQKNKSFILQLLCFCGLYVYSSLILFMYLFSFSEYEAQNLASIDRYFGTYLICLFIFCMLILINYIIENKSDKLSSNFNIAVIFIILLYTAPISIIINDTIFSSNTNKERLIKRESYNDAVAYSNILNSKTDKIYIISQNSQGEEYWILRYSFTPIKVSPNIAWSLGEKYYEGDIWTANISINEWSKTLKDYNYVYLNSVDDKFRNNYNQLFENSNEINSKSLYSIKNTPSGIKLEKFINEKENN